MQRIAHRSLVFIVMLAATATAQGVWKPIPPSADIFDWIQLKSGEWLKGEFIAMYHEQVEFDSKELKLLGLDWGDVAQVRTERIMEVRLTGDETARGKLRMRDKVLRVVGDESPTFDRARVISIAAGALSEFSHWSGKVSAGATMREGNSDQLEANLQVSLKRRTSLDRVEFDYLGVYNVSNEETIANNHRSNGTWNRFLTDRLFLVPVSLEYYRDPFQNISQRWTVGVGAGYDLLARSGIDWSVSAGPAFTWTKFENTTGQDDLRQHSFALTAHTKFEAKVTSTIDYTFEFKAQFSDRASGRYSHHLLTTVETEITRALDLDVSFVWDRIQDPQRTSAGETPEQNDFRVIVALGVSF